MIIGRDTDCEICIDHPSLSRQHAEIQFEDGKFRIVDLLSVNGVKVNGKPARERLLSNGDTIQLASVLLRYSDPGRLRAARPHFGRSTWLGAAGLLVLVLIGFWAARLIFDSSSGELDESERVLAKAGKPGQARRLIREPVVPDTTTVTPAPTGIEAAAPPVPAPVVDDSSQEAAEEDWLGEANRLAERESWD